ncbi:serine hydrolase domain-containing protein [Streptomyces sp. NPDC047017]|uniref:serine hydrolase domain-containing protein n=1 Tax=Streptomyces sp. NPDC047017 TaxID=3155024 RepID=UPI0033F3D514
MKTAWPDLRALADELARVTGPGSVTVGLSRAGRTSVATGGPGDATGQTRFRIASLTKVFTCAALVRMLRARGIALGTPAVELLPELAPDWRADTGLTVEQILGQVSGLHETVDSATAAALGEGPDALTEAARLVVRAGNARAPGARWSYYNGNYFLAGALLATLGGVPYEQVLRDELLAPWRLDRTGFAPPADALTGRDGTEEVAPLPYPRTRRPSGGLWSCVPDLLVLGQELLADRALLAEVRKPRTLPDDPMSYGLGWAVGPSGQLYLNGRLPGFRAAMLLVPDAEHVSVILSGQQRALPAMAGTLSEMQRGLTGDDLRAAIDGFAA